MMLYFRVLNVFWHPKQDVLINNLSLKYHDDSGIVRWIARSIFLYLNEDCVVCAEEINAACPRHDMIPCRISYRFPPERMPHLEQLIFGNCYGIL
jgi:hypothetical protein